MFDKSRGVAVALQHSTPPALQLVHIEIMPMGGGRLSVSLAATYLDEETLQFVNDEIDGAVVASVDEALSALRGALTDAFRSLSAKEGN